MAVVPLAGRLGEVDGDKPILARRRAPHQPVVWAGIGDSYQLALLHLGSRAKPRPHEPTGVVRVEPGVPLCVIAAAWRFCIEGDSLEEFFWGTEMAWRTLT